MLPQGFKAYGLHCGIAKKKDKKDIAIFYSQRECITSGMFTANLVKAAPVIVSQNNLNVKSGSIHAIIVNSGGANACTGAQGLKDAKEICSIAAKGLNIVSEEVLVASTGVIGQHLPMPEVRKGIKSLINEINNDVSNENFAVESMMTTDTFSKISSKTITIDGKKINIWGCVKGAGMIHPDLTTLHATMLGFILTDAAISKKMLDTSLNFAVQNSFNCVSVDGDTSTNDTVIFLANGAAENTIINKNNENFSKFSKAVNDVCLELAKMIAKDGEGATRLIEIEVKNAKDEKSAKKIAATIATSPLVKTAVFGLDANWGRIIAAAGRAGVKINPDTIDINLGNILVTRNGAAANYSEAEAKKVLEQKEIKITVNLKQGKAKSKYFTCDFSFDYVKINASYRS